MGSGRCLTDLVRGWVVTIIHSESVVMSTLGGEAACAGLALMGSIVGMLTSQMEGKAHVMCGGSCCGPGLHEKGSCVGVFVGRAWFCQSGWQLH